MSKKPRKPSNNTKDFSNKIIKILTTNSNRAFNYKQLAALLEVDDTEVRQETEVLGCAASAEPAFLLL